METLKRKEALVLWDQWWDELQSEWFKIEVLQDYSGEDSCPSLDAWLVGDKEKSIKLMIDEYSKEWVTMCQKTPATLRRFHVVEKPHTPYLEWEIELYKQVNIPLCGEQIYLIPAESVNQLGLPDGDVMIFDQSRVVRNHYNAVGKMETMEFYINGIDDISDFLHLQEELPKHAIPIA